MVSPHLGDGDGAERRCDDDPLVVFGVVSRRQTGSTNI